MGISTDFETISTAPASPGSSTELRLKEIWSDLLQNEAIGLDDDFFELGGNSLLAVNLFARIESQLGLKLPLSTIIEAPTIGQLTRLLETGATLSPVVTLRKGSSKIPLFLIHDADGETMLYRSLALHLDPGQTVYGLQPRSAPELPNLDTRLEEMAAFQLANIREIQPEGPYLLGGLCAGGHIGFEIARQLQRQGEDVAMVALFDAADVAAKAEAVSLLPAAAEPSRVDARAQGRSLLAGASLPARRAVKLARSVLRKAGNLGRFLVARQIQVIRDEWRIRLFRLYRNRGWQLPEFLRGISVRTTTLSARRHYRPGTALRRPASPVPRHQWGRG